MAILDEVCDEATWRGFLTYKSERAHASARELAALTEFIETGCFREVCERLSGNGFGFGIPERREINRFGARRKRVVYSLPPDETYVLKLIAFLLHRYDAAFAPNCYAFRCDMSAKRAISSLASATDGGAGWWYKLDIHDYFNSIDVARLLPKLAALLADDPEVCTVLSRMLTADVALVDGVAVEMKRGAMAGLPVSPFFANIYLDELDRHFAALPGAAAYARYSDDVLILARSEAEREACAGEAGRIVAELGLEINREKECRGGPGDAWTFLGVSYAEGVCDLSAATVKKLKGKIKRKSRALYRWKCAKGADDERAMRAFVRSINRKLYANRDANDLTWARWFFPLITTDASLHEIDRSIRDGMRYVTTGAYNKGNYRIRMETLKELGLRNTVNEYHRFRKNGFELR